MLCFLKCHGNATTEVLSFFGSKFSILTQSPDSALVIPMDQAQCMSVYFICLSGFIKLLEDAINHMDLDSDSPARTTELDSILMGPFQFETSSGLNSREYIVLLHATV